MVDESYKLDEIGVRVPDLMNLVEVLNTALGLHQAEDLAKCHRNLVDARYSPLTELIKECRDRVDGYVQDYWAAKGRAQAEAAYEEGDDDGDGGDGDDLPDLPIDVRPLGQIDPASKAPPMQLIDDEDDDGPE